MKQAQFITLMSESLGVEEKTIKMIVRNLREAGLFTTGARGVNAPDIQPIDAVRVVIAVVASPSPGKAVRDVKYFGPLKPDCREGMMRPMLGLIETKRLRKPYWNVPQIAFHMIRSLAALSASLKMGMHSFLWRMGGSTTISVSSGRP